MLAPSLMTTIDTLVAHVARFGVRDSEEQIASLARLGRRHGVASPVLDEALDVTRADVVRERAVAVTARALRTTSTSAPISIV